MSSFHRINTLIKNEFAIEMRSKTNLSSAILFSICCCFVAYMSVKSISDPQIWNALFWVILLFASFQATQKSFRENKEQEIYLHSLISAKELLQSKIIYNFIVLLITTSSSLIFYIIFLDNKIGNIILHLTVILSGVVSFSILLTITNAIARKVSINSALHSILALPILIPILVLLIGGTNDSLSQLNDRSFLAAEMYDGESRDVVGQVINTGKDNVTMQDDQEKSRTLNSALFPNEVKTGDWFQVSLVYSASNNSYSLKKVVKYQEKSTFEAWLKIGILLSLSAFLLVLGLLIFPKFWNE